MSEQAPGFYRRRVGDFIVTALNDGYLDAPLAVMTGIAPEEASAILNGRFHGPTPRLMVHAYLIQGGGQTILVDTGAGGNFGPSAGHLLKNLAAAGVQPGDVDLILLTHLHGDHVGGLATPAGTAVFPKAELAYPSGEAAYWLEGTGTGDAFDGAKAAVAPYRARMRSIEGHDAAPGITLVPLPGHTPGHSGYKLGEGADALLIWGDVIHVPDIQSARPEIGVGFDVDPVLAIATRQAILAKAADEKFAIAGMHLHFPTFAHVARSGTGYELIPDQWVPVV